MKNFHPKRSMLLIAKRDENLLIEMNLARKGKKNNFLAQAQEQVRFSFDEELRDFD